MNCYNENDPKAAAWLRELITAGLIPFGHVDERSICDVQPGELAGFLQCHWFAGIGGWSLALRLAGISDDEPIWTGSCPCQPFSCAGKGEAQADERHLWPEMFRLIRECRPERVFGEQVESAIGHGWLDGISAGLERESYAVGAAVLGAHSVGAPHKRQRLYWVADNQGQGRHGVVAKCTTGQQQRTRTGSGRTAGALGHSNSAGRQPGKSAAATAGHREAVESASGHAVAQGDSIKPRLEGLAGNVRNGHESRRDDAGTVGSIAPPSPWSDFQIIQCRDGKARRVSKPIFFIESDGVSAIMGDRWVNCLAEIEKEINLYAEKNSTGPSETLRALWLFVASKTLQWTDGGHGHIPEEELLLIALCQLTRGMGSIKHGSTFNFTQVCEVTMRIVWKKGTPACPSHKSELARSSPGESENALRWLPPWEDALHKKPEVHSLFLQISEARNVPEAFSAVEKIWRSILDQDSGERSSFQSGKSCILAMDGWPLADSVQSRVALLKGAGNAIVPQVAAEFITAYLNL